MTTTLQVVQVFDTYKAGDQISVSDATAQTLLRAYPGRFQFVSSDASSGGASPGTGGGTSPGGGGSTPPGTGTPSLTLSDVDGEITTALTAKGLPPGTTVPGLIAQAGTGSGVTAAQSIVNALIFG